jgi:hypothetical protein
MRDKYGDDFYLEERSRKHRYIMFLGNKREKRDMIKSLNYKIEDYPKNKNINYDTSTEIEKQLYMF